MSIASEITRLQQAKADIKTAIEGKGVTVPSDATLDAYDGYIDDIPSGGGGDWETIARGMVDFTTEFAITQDIGVDVKPYAFRLRKITSIVISDQCTVIGTYGFASCSLLASVTMPDSVRTIASNAFLNCSSLTELTLGTGVESIQGYSLDGSGITKLELPASLTSIAAEGCRVGRALTEVICHATTPPTAGTNIFAGDTNLTSIYVPDASVSAYQSATNWTTYASKIKGISERPTT